MIYPLEALESKRIVLQSPIYGLNLFVNRVLMRISLLASLQVKFCHGVFQRLHISLVQVAKLEVLEGNSIVISRDTLHLLAAPVARVDVQRVVCGVEGYKEHS